jgi:hypothetical protein
MQVAYCDNCKKHTGHKRAIGVGTLLGAVVTSGVSLLAVPAYGKRCIICGLTAVQATKLNTVENANPAPSNRPFVWGIFAIGMLIYVACVAWR